MAPDDESDAGTVATNAFIETMADGAVDAVADHFAEDLVYHRSSGERAGRGDLASDIEMFHTAFPDLSGTVDRVVTAGERVSFIYHLKGTHEGEFEGIPPTRREMEAKGAAIARVSGDRITEYRIVFDNLGMLEQLGVLGE
jgi:steroid delta-isomerase-like uncharacterized protein